MGIDITGWIVDAVMGAGRVSLRPGPVDGWSSYGGQTSTLSGLAAGAPLFTLRNSGQKQIVVRRLQFQFIQLAAFLAPQRLEWQLHIARNWTAVDTGGIALNPTSGRHRYALAQLGIDARVNLGLALTAGARALDPHPLAIAAAFAGGVGTNTGAMPMITTDAGDHPVVLGANEGLVLSNGFAMGATGTGIAYVNLELAEGAYP